MENHSLRGKRSWYYSLVDPIATRRKESAGRFQSCISFAFGQQGKSERNTTERDKPKVTITQSERSFSYWTSKCPLISRLVDHLNILPNMPRFLSLTSSRQKCANWLELMKLKASHPPSCPYLSNKLPYPKGWRDFHGVLWAWNIYSAQGSVWCATPSQATCAG